MIKEYTSSAIFEYSKKQIKFFGPYSILDMNLAVLNIYNLIVSLSDLESFKFEIDSEEYNYIDIEYKILGSKLTIMSFSPEYSTITEYNE